MNRDNHAGKTEDANWLGGFFDGEGYIGLYKRNDHRPSRRLSYRASVVIANTDKETIDRTSEILHSFNIPHRICLAPSKNGWRECWTVKIDGLKRMEKFVYFIEKYCFTKRHQVSLMKEFVEKRMAVNKNVPYSKRDHEIYEELKRKKRL